MSTKPLHLSEEYASQFRDVGVANAYRTRPPYPPEVFEILGQLLPTEDLPILDLGCGTGEIAIPMSRRVTHVDALDASIAMLRVARGFSAEASNIRWINATAEAYTYEKKYGLVVAAASFHWMSWDVVLRKLAAALAPSGVFAIVDISAFQDAPWRVELLELIPQYSTNRAYQRINLVDELLLRGLVKVLGRRRTVPVSFRQDLGAYVESFHARNGFSRERMGRIAAARFDSAVRSIVAPHTIEGIVQTEVQADVVWGVPTAA